MEEIPAAYPKTFDVKKRPEPGYRVITFSAISTDGNTYRYVGVLTEDYLDGRRLTVGRLASDNVITFKVTGIPCEEERLLKPYIRQMMENSGLPASIGFFEYHMRTLSEMLYEDTAILAANMVNDMCRSGRRGVTIKEILDELSANEDYREEYANKGPFHIKKSLEVAMALGLLEKTSKKGQTRLYYPIR